MPRSRQRSDNPNNTQRTAARLQRIETFDDHLAAGLTSAQACARMKLNPRTGIDFMKQIRNDLGWQAS